MTEPTEEQVQRGTTALVPFVQRWRLPLNPENVELMAYAVLRASESAEDLTAICDASERLLDEDEAGHARMLRAMREALEKKE